MSLDERMREVSDKLSALPLRLAQVLTQGSPSIAVPSSIMNPPMPSMPSSQASNFQSAMSDFRSPLVSVPWSKSMEPPPVRGPASSVPMPPAPRSRRSKAAMPSVSGPDQEITRLLTSIHAGVEKAVQTLEKLVTDESEDQTDDAERVSGVRDFEESAPQGVRESAEPSSVSVPASGFRPQRHVPSHP